MSRRHADGRAGLPAIDRRRFLIYGGAAAGALGVATLPALSASASGVPGSGQETVGGGTISDPAVAPAPSFQPAGSGFVPVKNWDFGQSGTIKDTADLAGEFQFHDQFNTIDNGGNYGAVIVAPNAASALDGQPVEDPNQPVRRFMSHSMQTYLVPLGGTSVVTPALHNTGCGSIQARFTLPNGGSLLGQDLLWETRVRYVTPPYFWFALWTSGNEWNQGAEMDLIESFGFDNGGGFTNFDGHLWHCNSFGTDNVDFSSWPAGMAAAGITSYDATQYHIWQWLYRKDDSYQAFVDGIEVQSGTVYWTLGDGLGGQPINMSFIFDAGWGHNQVASVDHSLPASALTNVYYEFDYSRVYLR